MVYQSAQENETYKILCDFETQIDRLIPTKIYCWLSRKKELVVYWTLVSQPVIEWK